MKKLKDINWNHLYCFYEVGRSQSLKEGAKSMGIAPSTLSAQLKSLEENFKTQLFHRSSKGLSLTSEGLVLFERTRLIFEEGNKILEKYSEDAMGGYPVSIGIEDTITYDLASEFASQYWDLYTSFGVVNTLRHADFESIIENLQRGVIDWGISLQKPKNKQFSHAEIGSFEIVYSCATELYDKFKNEKDILVDIPFALSNSDETMNRAILKHLQKLGITPKEKMYSDHQEFIQKLTERGRCVTYLSRNPLKKYSNLTFFDMGAPLKIHLYAIWKKEDEKLISITKLKNLIQTKLSQTPHMYRDIDYQIEVSEVEEDKLNS